LAFDNFTRTGGPTIYWMFADGSFRPGFGNPDAVTRDVDAAAPAWSPDGQFVAFVGGSGQILGSDWDKVVWPHDPDDQRPQCTPGPVA
jgi:Tol biopolymer transport system component